MERLLAWSLRPNLIPADAPLKTNAFFCTDGRKED